MNKWVLLHTYNSLAENGQAAFILCPDDGLKLVPIIDPDEEEPIPALYCGRCDSITRPGLDLWQQIRAVALEHYDEDEFI